MFWGPDSAAPYPLRNQTCSIGLNLMARIGSRSWTAAQIAHLMVLMDRGCSAASIAVSLKRSITNIRAKARNLGKPFAAAAAPSSIVAAANRARHGIMRKFFFDMKDGVPFRDRIGIDFETNAEAIDHCKELAQHFRDDSLTDDQDLEISVVNAVGREIHREYVHRE
jgi:hypothetical protein